MARKLEIGNGLQLPLQWMTMSSVVYGTRGSGKSTFGRKIAEEVANFGQRFCAIDPTGAFWGLKSSESGTDYGLPVVIFGGDHADVPLEPGAGSELADIVAEIDQSVILDLELLSKGRQIVFIGAFLERLYHINREPLLLLMDEAQRYAPQKPMSPDATKTLGAAEDIVKLGRKHGLGSVVFTQRGSGLNKEVSELGDVLIAFRTPGVLDQKRVKEWLDANATEEQAKQVLGSISGLPTGTAIFASNHPDLKLFATVAIERPRTFDSSSTPQVGQKRREPRVLSKPDLEALNTRMAGAIERAKADDPKELRKRIAQLENEVLAAKFDQKRTVVTETVEVEKPVPFIPRELKNQIQTLAQAARPLTGQIDELLRKIDTAMQGAYLGNPEPAGVAQSVERRSEVPKVAGSTPAPGTTSKPSDMLPARPPSRDEGSYLNGRTADGDPMKLGKAERQILGVLQTHGPRTRSQLALQTGYSPRTSTLSVALSRLRQLGLITPSSNPVGLTDEGRAVDVGDVEVLPKPGPELAAYWIDKLGKAEREILRVMVDVHPDQLDREGVASATGYSTRTSTLSVALSRLRKLELVNGWEVSPDLIG